MKKMAVLLIPALILAGTGLALARAKTQPANEIPASVLEVFKRCCASCHAGESAPKGLRLVPGNFGAVIDAPSVEMPKLKLIDTANPESSYLLKKILGAGDINGSRMPRGIFGGKHLAKADLKVLQTWILGLKSR